MPGITQKVSCMPEVLNNEKYAIQSRESLIFLRV